MTHHHFAERAPCRGSSGACFLYGTGHILAGFHPGSWRNFVFPRTRIELLFSEPHAELKGRIVFGGLLRIFAVIGALLELCEIVLGLVGVP